MAKQAFAGYDHGHSAMNESCPNCGKPLLPTDTACWHCGYTLARKPAKPAAPARPVRAGRQTASPPATYDFRALAVYGGLTLAVLAALLLVMGALGRRPILVRSALNLTSDWVALTATDLSFTLSLPPDWQWLDVAYRDQDDVLRQLTAVQGYIDRALRPPGGPSAGLDIVAVGLGTRTPESGEPATFVVIGRDPALDGAGAETLLALARERYPEATETRVDTRIAGQPQARYTLLDAPAGYQCRHLALGRERQPGYLIAACAPQAEYGNRERDLGAILDSFQLLQP
jgi:hypothetical protein